MSTVKYEVKEEMKEYKVANELKERIASKYDNIQGAFKAILTEYRRLKVFKNTGCYIQSQRYIVGDQVDDKLENGEVVKKIIEVTANFIPMRDVLRKFVNLP